MNLNASGKALSRPCSMSRTTCSCLTAAYCSLRRSTSGTPKYSSAARAPANRGLPAISCWYTWVVNRSAVQLVWSRISRQSSSNSSLSASRQASSCGESTSTPSTSKIAPWNLISPPRYCQVGCRRISRQPSSILRRAHVLSWAAMSSAISAQEKSMPSSGEPYDDQEFRPNRRTRPARDAGLLLVDLTAGKPLCRDLLWRELNPRGRRGGGSCLTRPDVPSHENGAED